MGRNIDIISKKTSIPEREPVAPVVVSRVAYLRQDQVTGNFAFRKEVSRRQQFFSWSSHLTISIERTGRGMIDILESVLREVKTLFTRRFISLGMQFRMRRYRLRVVLRRLSSRYRILGHPASPFRVLRPSRLAILAAILFGMAMTHTVERMINGNASADTATKVAGVSTDTENAPMENLSSVNAESGEEKPFEMEILSQFIDEKKQDTFETEVRKMVAGYPIESMLPFIFEKDRITATFLIGIAKKESNWGRRVPVLDGQDCFNYWGFREKRRLMGTGGHTCFNSKKDAVESVSKRIESLIYDYERNTPEKMIIWKCGYSCAGHSPESVRKWISDVEGYYNTLNEAEKE